MERLTSKQLHILQNKLCGMKNRCYDPNNKFYKDYGARGITVCDEWQGKDGHKNFQKWALESGWQEGYSIDRIDVNGNYEPLNCRWADAKEQANNRRNNILVTINGVTKNATEWAEEIGISERAFMSRIKYGWSEERLLEPKYKPLKMSKAEMSKEIREWRKLEEKGLLLRFPVVVGSTVYIISRGKIIPLKIDGIYINENSIAMQGVNEQYFGYGKVTLYDSKKPIEWFLTKEEAEQALKQMGE